MDRITFQKNGRTSVYAFELALSDIQDLLGVVFSFR